MPTTLATDVDEGLLLPADARGVVTVGFDGRYVWSFRAERDGRRTVRGVVVPWPVALRPYLAGRTRLTLAQPDTGAVLLDSEAAIGA
ncbi:MAG: hypothetical protein HOQ45_02715, partial [Nocardioidaceae bacterium]|nr:hypothetical protein [Nocardioidaceae bacterium]